VAGPLLDLDTLVVRPVIRIDGEACEILSPDELPVLTSHALASKGRRMDELMKLPELNRDQRGELEALVQQISGAIMEPVPQALRDKLSDAQRMAVIEAFTALLLSKKAGTAAALFKGLAPRASDPPPSTGASAPPGSSGSTAETPATGSGKPRSRS